MPRLPRQNDEHRLRDLFGGMDIPDASQRRGIDEINVPPNEFGEGVFGICPGKLAEQFGVRRHFDFQLIAPAQPKIAQEKSV